MEPERFLTHSLRSAPRGRAIARILSSALESVDPAAAVRHCLLRQGHTLRAGKIEFDLEHIQRIFVVGAGKAGAPMAAAACQVLGDRIEGGVVIVKQGYLPETTRRELEDTPLAVLVAGHPLPDQRGVEGTRRILELLSGAGNNDLVLALISGGGSALLTAPAPGIELSDLQALTGQLLASGATINEINTLRKHLELAKGGGLARSAAPAPVLALVLSDVVGSPLDVIASGPAVPDPSTYQQALEILVRYGLDEKAPKAIRGHLQRGVAGETPETLKPGDPVFQHVHNLIIGSNLQAAQAALGRAQQEGFHPLLLTTFLEGEARQAGAFLAAVARQAAQTGQPAARPACIVAGGETTVTLQGDGLGGRNQELALGAVTLLAGLEGAILVSLATDGGDGPTDAAGAVVTGATLARARQAGLEPDDYLGRNDAYHFFAPLGDLLLTGPTMTNVNDLVFLFLI